MPELDIVILGLSLTSSWGNGHATTYRALIRALNERGHRVLFLERNVPWYASARDMPKPSFCQLALYEDLNELKHLYEKSVREADGVIVGSYVPEGVEVGDWVNATADGVTAFYDIDTPVTILKLEHGDFEYLTPEQIKAYDLYLSVAGGPTLQMMEQRYGAHEALPLYCSFDSEEYYQEDIPWKWLLGYMGTYSQDRQSGVDHLLLEPALRMPEERFVVAGAQYPKTIQWPENVERLDQVPPGAHRTFYNSQPFTLNLTRQEMIRTGYSPSARLFEAVACGTAIISDHWEGMERFFEIGSEIFLAEDAEAVVRLLTETSNEERVKVSNKAQERVLKEHTSAHRARELEGYLAKKRARLAR